MGAHDVTRSLSRHGTRPSSSRRLGPLRTQRTRPRLSRACALPACRARTSPAPRRARSHWRAEPPPRSRWKSSDERASRSTRVATIALAPSLQHASSARASPGRFRVLRPLAPSSSSIAQQLEAAALAELLDGSTFCTVRPCPPSAFDKRTYPIARTPAAGDVRCGAVDSPPQTKSTTTRRSHAPSPRRHYADDRHAVDHGARLDPVAGRKLERRVAAASLPTLTPAASAAPRAAVLTSENLARGEGDSLALHQDLPPGATPRGGCTVAGRLLLRLAFYRDQPSDRPHRDSHFRACQAVDSKKDTASI